MRRSDLRKTRSQAGVARARALLKQNAGWLPGHPVALETGIVRWRSVPASGVGIERTLLLGREELRRAQAVITKLRYNFPRALPRIVDNVDGWIGRTERLMDLLKGWIHRAEAFSFDDAINHDRVHPDWLPRRWTSTVDRIRREHPDLTRLLESLAFIALSHPREPQLTDLRWIESNWQYLERLGHGSAENQLDLPLRFFTLRDRLPTSLLESLCECFCNPDLAGCRTPNRLTALEKAVRQALANKQFHIPAEPDDATLAESLRNMFDQIVSHRARRQRVLFRLLAVLIDSEVIEHLRKVSRGLATSERETCRALRRRQAAPVGLAMTPEQRRELKTYSQRRPELSAANLRPLSYTNEAIRLIDAYSDAECECWTDFFGTIPTDKRAVRVGLFCDWSRFVSGHANAHTRNDFFRLLRDLTSLFRQRGVADFLLEDSDKPYALTEFVRDSYGELNGSRTVSHRIVRILEEVVYKQSSEMGRDLLSSLGEFAKATTDVTSAASVVMCLARGDDAYYHVEDLRFCFQMADDTQEIARLVRSVDRSFDNLTEFEKPLIRLAADPILRRAIAERIAADDVKTISQLGGMTRLLEELGEPIGLRRTTRVQTSWIHFYPEELHESLTELARSSPKAEHVAAELLGKDVPSPAKLSQQIGAIESKLNDQPRDERSNHLQRRLENLKKRLGERPTLSDQRLANLNAKIHARTSSLAIQEHLDSCRENIARSLKHRFDMPEIPEQLLSPPLDAVLSNIFQLRKPMRELGLRLLFESMSRGTRDFDDEPANVEFRERISKMGVAMEPWLSDSLTTSATDADGIRYQVSFTRDTIDFLLMGFHFRTCLSPGDFNFFSTVANAVDVNKRVAYGKTATGRIVGRCLFALNDDGQILTYHRYSHDPKDGFAEAIDRFASDLASAMQTSVATAGRVARLVAREWYDDGAVGQGSDWLADDGALPQCLQDFSGRDAVERLLQEVPRHVVLSRIVDVFSNVGARRNLGFLECLLLEFERDLSTRQRILVAVTCQSADVTRRLLDQTRWQDLIRLLRANQCDACDVFHGVGSYTSVFQKIAQYNPSLAIRAIRGSRVSRVRSDADDQSVARRRALALVHRQLGRNQRAEQLESRTTSTS